MTSVTYPSVYNHSGTFTTSFDTMSRPSSMTDGVGVFTISNVSYGPANELLSIGYSQCAGCSPYIEGRTYNSRLQLTAIGSLQYIYPAGPNNNGKASEQKVTGGEDVVYAYDALNRLISAQTTSNSSTTWGQSFVYDGFGNLYQKNPINAPALSVGVNSATNQLSVSGVGYDANGNTLGPYPMSQTYDVENRVSSAGQYNIPQVLYAYDGGNRRVWKGTYNSSGVMQTQEAYFYAPNGQKLGTYALVLTNPPGYSNYATATDLNVFFGGKRVGHGVNNAGTVVLTATSQDRVGSYGSYYPYGEDKGTPLTNDQMKFATYTRDSATGLDYAMNRYYSSAWGRFGSPDPYMNSGGPGLPQSWNRYAYVIGDPMNLNDPQGTTFCFVDPSTGAVVSCYDSVDVNAGLDGGYWGGSGSNSGSKNIPTDPLGLNVRQAWNLAYAYKSLVGNGTLNSCQALADFAQDASDQSASQQQFVNAFGAFVDKSFGTAVSGLSTSPVGVFLYAGGDNGFTSVYQNTAPDNNPGPCSCLLYTSPSPRDGLLSRMPSSA